MPREQQLKSGQKILTVYGQRAYWLNQDMFVQADSINRGYATLTDDVYRIFANATIHSVSYSVVQTPPNEHGYVPVWLYATVLYSGDIPADIDHRSDDEYGGYRGMGEENMWREYL